MPTATPGIVDPPIFLGFSRATGFSAALGSLIRIFTGGLVNHAFLVYWSRDLKAWLTTGANSNGVTSMTVPEFLETRRIMHLYAPIGWSLWDGFRAHVSDLNRHYDYRGLIGMAHVEILKRLTGRPGRNWMNDHAEVFCSEWCTQVARSGMDVPWFQNPNSKPPRPSYAFLPQYHDDQVDPETLDAAAAANPSLFNAAVLSVLQRPWTPG